MRNVLCWIEKKTLSRGILFCLTVEYNLFINVNLIKKKKTEIDIQKNKKRRIKYFFRQSTKIKKENLKND